MMTALVIHFVMSQQKSVMLVVKGGTYPRTAPVAMREAKGATTVASLATSLVIAPMKQVSPKTIHVSSAVKVRATSLATAQVVERRQAFATIVVRPATLPVIAMPLTPTPGEGTLVTNVTRPVIMPVTAPLLMLKSCAIIARRLATIPVTAPVDLLAPLTRNATTARSKVTWPVTALILTSKP